MNFWVFASVWNKRGVIFSLFVTRLGKNGALYFSKIR